MKKPPRKNHKEDRKKDKNFTSHKRRGGKIAPKQRRTREEIEYQRKIEIFEYIKRYNEEKNRKRKAIITHIFYSFLFFLSSTYLHAIEISHNILPDFHPYTIILGMFFSLVYYYIGLKSGQH